MEVAIIKQVLHTEAQQTLQTEAQKTAYRLQKVLKELLLVEKQLRDILLSAGLQDQEILNKFKYKDIQFCWLGVERQKEARFLRLVVNDKVLPERIEDLGRADVYKEGAVLSYVNITDLQHLVNNLQGFMQNIKEKLVELQKIEVKDINI